MTTRFNFCNDEGLVERIALAKDKFLEAYPDGEGMRLIARMLDNFGLDSLAVEAMVAISKAVTLDKTAWEKLMLSLTAQSRDRQTLLLMHILGGADARDIEEWHGLDKEFVEKYIKATKIYLEVYGEGVRK